MKKRTIVGYVSSIAIAEAVGLLSGWLAGDTGAVYRSLTLPPGSPPGWVFPVAWAILYALMGIAAYPVFASGDGRDRRRSLTLYGVQLFVNFLWSIVFFRFRAFGAAIAVIVVLDILVLWLIARFHRASRVAAYLLIPYFLWIAFATYLAIGVFALN